MSPNTVMKGTGRTKRIYLLYNFKYHSFYNSVLAFLLFPRGLKKGAVMGLLQPVRGPEVCFLPFFPDEGNKASGAFKFLIV